MEKRWELRRINFTPRGKYPSLIEKLLCARGIENPDIFFHPSPSHLHSPFLFEDMERAVSRIKLAIDRKEKIMVHGDYDADGITATALLLKILKYLGGDVIPYIPHRIEEGYGLSREGVERAKSLGVSLIITVDTGISSKKEVELADLYGMDVIITDHHEPPEILPPAHSIINPKLSETYPYRELSGVGTAFKLAQALMGEDERKKRFLFWQLDLVALGTVADIVPLTGENRTLVKLGLEIINRTKKPGLKALMKAAGIERVDAWGIGYILAPRINASGRIAHAGRALRLLLSGQERAGKFAKELESLNLKRRKLDEKISEEAFSKIPSPLPYGIVLAGEGWHEGVIGIVAGRIAEEFYRPTLLIALKGDKGKGSGRSIPEVNLYRVMEKCRDLFISFGGHTLACGFTIERNKIPELEMRFNEAVQEELEGKEPVPVIHIDAEIFPEEITHEVLSYLDLFSPFGPGNERPVFLIRDAEVVGYPGKIGGRHVKFRIRKGNEGIPVLGFNMQDVPQRGERLDIVFRIVKDTYMGRERITLYLEDSPRRRNVGA